MVKKRQRGHVLFTLWVIFSLIGPSYESYPYYCKPRKCLVDVLFLMNGSGSVTDAEFLQSKELVKSIACALGVNHKTHMALGTFGTDFHLWIGYNTYYNTQAFKQAVDTKVERPSGPTTDIDNAVNSALNILLTGRALVPKAVIIITDGYGTPPTKIKELQAQALVFGVGILKFNTSMLQLLTSPANTVCTLGPDNQKLIDDIILKFCH